MECKDLIMSEPEIDLEIPDNFDVMAMISIGQPKYLCNAIEEANDNSAHFPSLQFLRC
jgi:hypothetical protein